MSFSPPTPPSGDARPAPPVPPCVPDHELIRRIGRGAYGEVWLARSAIGAFRAVKIVHRRSFDHERPFEREFEGIQKFEPVSRTHDSQVDILHVGRGDDCFYYVMELADDQSTGGQINPDNYTPRTLKSELQFRGRIEFEECVRIGLALATALEHLHTSGLVHRDVKPSNIIFVNGVPKLADIGLVTGVDATRSYVGTEGFAAPEGPGTAQADIYSLGKVLYEVATGKDRQEFPELPTQLRELPDREGLMELNAVIAKACRHDPKHRYASAAAMRADLELLQSGKSIARLHQTEARLRFVQGAGAAVTAVAGLIAAGWLWQARQTQLVRELAAEKSSLLAREKAAHDQATAAEQTALKERDRALAAEREARAVLGFIQTNIIAAARPQTELGGLGRDVSVLRALEQAEQSISSFTTNQPLVEAQLRLELGRTYALLGDYAKSHRQYTRAVNLRRTTLGPNDLQTLDATADLADVLALSGKNDEGVRLLEDCAQQATDRFGPTAETTLDLLVRLGIAHRDAQDMDHAIATLRKAYELSSTHRSPEHPKTLQALNHLAVTHHCAGQTTQAVALLEALCERRSRALGPEHEETTCAMIDLARVYQQLGRGNEAQPLFEAALATRRRVQGPDHYATLIAIDSLAAALLQAGKFQESEPLCRESMRLRETKLGPDHLETLAAQRSLATLLMRWAWADRHQTLPSALSATSRRAGEAERLCRSSLAGESPVYSVNDRRLIETRNVLGFSLVVRAATATDLDLSPRLAKLTEAEQILLDARRDADSAHALAPTQLRDNALYLVRLYRTWDTLAPGTGMGEKAVEWRGRLQAVAPALAEAESR